MFNKYFFIKKKLEELYSKFISSIIEYFSLITKLLLLITIVSCYLYIRSSIANQQQIEYNSIQTSSNLIAQRINNNIKYTKYQLQQVAKQISQTNGYKSQVHKIFSDYNDNLNKYVWINKYNYLTVDKNKGILAKPANMKHRDYLSLTKKYPETIIFNEIVIGEVSKRIILPVAIGVLNNRQRYIGTLVVSIDVENLTTELEMNLSNSFAKFAILNQKKEVLFKSSNADLELINKIKLQDNSEFKTADKDFAITTAIKNIGKNGEDLYLIVTNDKESFNNKIDSLIIKQLLSCLLVFLFLSLLIAKIYYKIIRPIKILSQYANDIVKHKNNTILPEDLGSKEFHNLYVALHSIQNHIEVEDSLKEELRVANQGLQTLVKSINHDLRNYVSGVLGLSEIIEENIKNQIDQSQDINHLNENDFAIRNDELKIFNKESLDLINMIKSQSQEIFIFVKDLLEDKNIQSASQSDKNKVDQNSDFSLDELVKTLLFLNQKFIQKNGVIVKTHFDSNLNTVYGNKIRHRQIFDNLITNAIKYTKKGKTVSITIKNLLDNDTLYAEIKDEGIGMDSHEIDMAFSGEGQKIEKNNLEKEIDCHGIGLPLVKKSVDEIGAEMKVESKKNIGTTIKLYFKLSHIQDLKIQDNKPIILIADDEEINLFLLRRLINMIDTKQHYKIITVHDGLEVLEIIKKYKDQNLIKYIFLDINMPNLDGIKTAKKIREIPEYNNTSLIAVSGNNSQKNIDTALNAGFTKYLTKPLDKNKISDIICSR